MSRKYLLLHLAQIPPAAAHFPFCFSVNPLLCRFRLLFILASFVFVQFLLASSYSSYGFLYNRASHLSNFHVDRLHSDYICLDRCDATNSSEAFRILSGIPCVILIQSNTFLCLPILLLAIHRKMSCEEITASIRMNY